MQGELPTVWTYGFYVLIVWGLSALLVGFRLLAGSDRLALRLRIGAFVWLGVPAVLAASGWFADFEARPPLLMRVLLPMVGIIIAFAFSPWGGWSAQRLPFSFLIGTQLFRLPLELLLFALATRGFLPKEMTFAGYNYDILTGASAGLFWYFLRRGELPALALWAWNVLGFLALVTVVTIAVLAFPQFGWFTPPNELVAHYPWVWLPGFLVPLALLGHLLVLRKLLLRAEE